MMWLVILLLMIVLTGMAMYYLRGPLLGMLVTYAVKIGLRKKVKEFHLGSFNLLPFAMYDFRATMYATRKTPEGTVSWKSFRILLDITKIFDPLLSLLHILNDSNDHNIPKRGKMISFAFEDFAVSSPGMTYALFLDPPENKLPPEIITNADGDRLIPDKTQSSEPISYGLIIKRLMQHVILFIDIVFIKFSFNFQFPIHESKMIGKADIMTISFPRFGNKAISDTITVMNQIDKGEMEIFHQNQRAMFYKGSLAQISMDLHLPSGVMEVLMRIIGRQEDQMYITIAPFLEFYRRYTTSEDNSVEIRMARGLSTGGKMAMKLLCEYITITVDDIRCKEPLVLTIQELSGELCTYFLTKLNERIYKDMRYIDPSDIETTHNTVHNHILQYFLPHKSIEPIIMSPNKDKVMKGGVKRIDFHTNRVDSIAYIENIQGLKVKRVYNENDYIDNDCMTGIIKCIHMERIYSDMLDWLIVLQDTANRLPDSRFAHKKNSEMNFIAEMFLFSTQPVSVLYVPPVIPLPNRNTTNNTHENSHNSNINEAEMPELPPSDPPIDTLEIIPVDPDHWVRFRFNRMEAKRELPHGEVDSLIDFKCEKFVIDTSQPQNDLQLQFSLAAIGEEENDDSSSIGSSQEDEGEGIVQDDRSNSSDDDYFEVEQGQLDRENFSFADVYSSSEPRRRRSSGSMCHRTMQNLLSNNTPVENNVPDSKTPVSNEPDRKELSGPGNDSANIPTKSPAEYHHSTSRYTGSCWTFPAFTVRMKLGVKMHLEWVKAEHMQIEFLNSTSDLLTKGAGDPPVRHPFFLSTTLSAIWYGLSVSCDLGAVKLYASVAGLLKAQSAYAMIRRTADRVSGRMTFIKLRGPPGADIKVTTNTTHTQPPVATTINPKTTIRIDHFTIQIPVDITPEDHDKRLQHEMIREQRQLHRQQKLIEKIRSTRRGTFSSEHSDVQETTTTPLSEVLPSENFNPNNIDRSNKSLSFIMIAFEYSSSIGETIAEFESCKVTLNSYPERPWMIMSSVRYSKRLMPLVPEDAFYQGLDAIESSQEAMKITEKAVTELSIETFQMFFSARMELGLIVDSLLAQDAALKLATRPRKRYPMYLSVNQEENNEMEIDSSSDRRGSNLCRQHSDSTYNSSSLVDIDELPEQSEEADQPSEQQQSEAAEEEFAVIFGEEDDENEVYAKPNPTTMHIQFDAFVIIYDVHYQNEYVEEFMTAEFLGFDLYLDATKFPSAVQDEITLLDIGAEGVEEGMRRAARSSTSSPTTRPNPTTTDIDSEEKERDDLLVYGGVFGGQLRFGTKLFRLKVKPSNAPLLETEGMHFNGPVYNASVKDDRVPRYEMMIALSDSVPTYVCEDMSSSSSSSGDRSSIDHSRSEATATNAEQEMLPSPAHPLPVSILGATEPLFIILSRTAAPPKIYMDMSMTGKSFKLSLDHTTMECITAVNAVTDCIVPPNKDPSPQFVPWDMWRYLLHGSFSFNFNKMSVQYSPKDYLTQQVKLSIAMEHPQWYMDKGSFAITGQNIQLNADIQTTLLAGRRRGQNRLNSTPSVLTSKLCHIPAFIVSLTHYREDIREKISSKVTDTTTTNTTAARSPLPHNSSQYSLNTHTLSSQIHTHSHHDVYLTPALADPTQFTDTADVPLETYVYLNNDRYHYFRSRNMSIRWELEVRLADEEDVPISVNVRLDHLVRILDALNNTTEDILSSTAEEDDRELDGCLDITSDYFYGVTKPLAPLSIGDLISTLRVQLVLNKIIISSWHSHVNLGGFVMTIGSSDMQLRLTRDIPTELLYIPEDPGTPDSHYTSIKQKSKSRRSSLSPFYESNSTYKDHSRSNKTQDLAIFPMVIDHLYLETAFIELYVRNWSKIAKKAVVPEVVMTERRSLFSRPSISEGVPSTIDSELVNSEPQTSEEIQALFQPIYKNAHSTKMIISLTESGVVCTKDSVFVRSGILEKTTERILNKRTTSSGGARTSRRLPSGNILSALLDGNGEGSVFLIGRQWKEYLVRTKAATSSSNMATNTTTGNVARGRRGSAMSLQLTETKPRHQSRRTSITPSEFPPVGRRSSILRRSSLIGTTGRSRNHPRTESMASTNSGHSELLLPGPAPRVVSNRNRRSSVRAGYRPERAFTRTAEWDPLRDGYRASLLSFRTNHSAFTPPPSALPRSYGTTKAGFVQGKQYIQQPRVDEETSFGTKIWGLRITDLRLLFTIEIRDIWFGYIIRGMDLFQPPPTNNNTTTNTNTMYDNTKQQHRPSSINLNKESQQLSENQKATIYDFLQANERKSKKLRSKRLSKEERENFIHSPIRMLSPLQTVLDSSSDPMLQFLSSYTEKNSISPRSAKDFTQMMKLGGASPTKLPINKSKFQKGGRNLVRNNNIPINYHHEGDENEGISARMALEMESSSDEEVEVNNTISTSKPFQSSGNSGGNTTINTTSGKLNLKLPDPTELSAAAATSSKANTSQKGLPSHNYPTTTNTSTTAAVGSGGGGNGGGKKTTGPAASTTAPTTASKKAKKPLSEFFFIVELIDPQVNFLDVNTHSSLIIVAGLSSLEGKRYTDATLPPSSAGSPYNTTTTTGDLGQSTRESIGSPQARGSMSTAPPVPKRQQELRLRMDGVSAFTVPSNSPDDDNLDVVHWKHMESTECIDPIGGDYYIGRKRGNVNTTESPFMRMAIKDFQIRALYIFWTDVTVKEAKKMYLIPSKDELVCTFKLELPVICVDILSWQFYVIMHVIRNVLLVPPPASVSRVYTTQTEADEAEKNKILELMRDPVLLAKHDIRVNLNAELDLKYKHCRDELKLLIEENLAGAMMHMELGSARFVEVFVGSCTWILRMNSTTGTTGSSATPSNNSSSGSSSWEKEQLKVEVTGAHATFSYGEDRSASSLFEVQRFWAKDMDPGRDIVTIVKTQPAASTLGINPTLKSGSLLNNSSTGGNGSGGNTEKKEDSKLDSVVIMPVLGQTEHCSRCGAAFLLEENHATACTFHANQDGEPGEYKNITIRDDLTGVLNTLQAWTCCGKHHAFAIGCSSRPHTCKEVMIQIRAEANPTTRVENIDLSVLKSVDISIFPNSTYDIQVHITKSLADVLHKYFSIDDMENYEITANITENTTVEIEEKQKSNWDKVKNVRKIIQKKRNKGSSTGGAGSGNTGEGDDEVSVFSGGEERSPGPGGGRRVHTTTTTTPNHPTTPSNTAGITSHDVSDTTHTTKSSTFSSPWFSLTSKPSAAQQALNESSTHSDSTDSVNSKGKPRSRKSSFSLGSLFGKRDKIKSTSTDPLDLTSHSHTDHISVDGNRSHSVASTENQQPKQLKFNMLRARANSSVDKIDRKSITGLSHGLTTSTSDNPHENSNNNTTNTTSNNTAVTQRRQEGVYVKFLRLGGIQLEVTTAGFILNLTKFKAQMDEFRCQGEVLQWKTLVFNMERHLAVSLFTNAASNSLSRFTKMFRFTGSSITDGSSTSMSDYTMRSKSAVWEGSEDPGHATTLKRSALGLPPSAAAQRQQTAAEQKTEETDTAKAMRLLGMGGSSSKSNKGKK